MAVASQSHRPMLIPPRLRFPAWCAVSAAVLVLVLLAYHYSGATKPGRLDLGLERWLQMHVADPVGILHLAAYLGNQVPVFVMTLLVVTFGYVGGRWITVIFAVISPVTADIVTESLKPPIGRVINDYLAFPSGHATALISLLTVVMVLALDRRKWELRIVGVLIVLVLAAGFVGMAVALIYEHLHYATDIIGGVCVGFSVVLALALILDRIDRLWAGRPRRNLASR